MEEIKKEDYENAEEIADILIDFWNPINRSPIVAEIPAFRRRKESVEKFTKKMINKYPDFFDSSDLGRVSQHITYMDEVLGAKRDITRVRNKDIEYFGAMPDTDYKGKVFSK